jgi:hypothetical protein
MIYEEHDVPLIQRGLGFESMYAKQIQSMELLFKANKLVPYPVDLQSKEGQVTIRQYFDFFEEELFEFNETYLKGIVKYQNPNLIKKDEFMGFLKELHDEMADIYHFSLELLIFSDIGPIEVREVLKQISADNNWGAAINMDNLLNSIFTIAKLNNAYQQVVPQKNTYLKIELDEFIMALEGEPYYKMGLMLGTDIYPQLTQYTYSVLSEYRAAFKLLKNKPWREGAPALNENKFQTQLIMGFLSLNGLLANFGCDEACLYNSYVDKNNEVLERIKNQY